MFTLKTLSLGLVTCVLATLACAGSASASTVRERALARQVATLTAKLKIERTTSAGLRAKLATTSADLTTAQKGAMPAVTTMSPEAMWTTLLPALDVLFQREKVANALRSYDDPQPPFTLATYSDHAFDADYTATGVLKSAHISLSIYGPAF